MIFPQKGLTEIPTIAYIIICLLTYKKYYAEHAKYQNIYVDFFVKGKVNEYLFENGEV